MGEKRKRRQGAEQKAQTTHKHYHPPSVLSDYVTVANLQQFEHGLAASVGLVVDELCVLVRLAVQGRLACNTKKKKEESICMSGWVKRSPLALCMSEWAKRSPLALATDDSNTDHV